jgi:hypothetical protein
MRSTTGSHSPQRLADVLSLYFDNDDSDEYELVVQLRLAGHGPTLFAGYRSLSLIRTTRRNKMQSQSH